MPDGSLHLTDDRSILRLIEASDDLLVILELDGTIKQLSRGWERVLGWRAAEMIGRGAVDFAHPDDAGATRRILEGVEHDEALLRFNNRYAVKGGGWQHLEWCAVVSALDGLIHASVRALSGEDDDTTRAASRTAEVEAISGVGSYEVDLLGGNNYLSAVTCAIHELPEDEPPSLDKALSFHPPEARTTLDPALEVLQAQGTPYDLELPFVTATGRRRWVRVTGAGEVRDGKVVRLFGTFEDITERREERARLSDFADIVELAHDGIWVIDAEGHTSYANPRMAEMLGLPVDVMIGRPFTDFMDDESRARALVLFSEQAAGSTERHDFRLQRADGSALWVSMSARPRKDSDGRMLSAIATVTDISERVEAEEKLREREALYAALVELSPIGITLTDAETGTFLDANPALLALTGYTREELVERTYWDLSPVEQAPIEMREGTALQDTGRYGPFEASCISKDGTNRPVRLRGVRVTGRDGRDLTWSLVEDITEERAQREALERLGDVAQKTTNLVVIADRDGLIEWVNRAFEVRTGWRLAEVRGCRPGRVLQCERTDPETIARIGQALRAVEPVEADILNRSRSGEHYWIRIEIQPRFDAMGEHIGFIAVQTDITEITRARDTAEAANRAKSEFLASISHEIRTPLNGVLGMADLLADTALQEDQRAMLDTIRSSGWSLLSLLNDILDLARVEAGRLQLDPQPFDLGALVHDLELLHGANARAKGIGFDLHCDRRSGLRRIGDETRIRQILHNLLGNAVKFTEAGAVTLEVLPEDADRLLFRVVDTGIGMSQDQIARVFEPFEQAEAGTARRFGGTGLGMTIVQRLVDMMEGQIRIDSAPGQGTSVEICLPVQQVATLHTDAPLQDEDEDQGASVAESGLRGLRVLVADDTASNRLLLSALMDRLGVKCSFAQDGAEAVDLWRQGDFDLVLLDISMPVMDGFEALRVMQKEAALAGAPPPCALAATANVMTDQIAQYLAAGFVDTLPKPFRRQQLVEGLLRASAR